MPEREENVLIRAVVCGVAGPRQTMSYFPPVTYAKWLDTVRDAEEFIREHTCEGWAWERRIYRVHAGQGRRVRIGTWNPDGPTLLLDPAKPVPAAHCGIIGLQPVKVFDPASAYYATTDALGEAARRIREARLEVHKAYLAIPEDMRKEIIPPPLLIKIIEESHP